MAARVRTEGPGHRHQEVQRNPRLRHLPLPKAGLLVRCLTRDGTDCCRETARSRRNEAGIINLIPVEFER